MAERQMKWQGHLKELAKIFEKLTPGMVESFGLGSSIAQSIDNDITQQLDDIRN